MGKTNQLRTIENSFFTVNSLLVHKTCSGHSSSVTLY